MFLNVPRFEPTPTGRFKTIMWLLGAAIFDQGRAQFVAMPLLLLVAARLQSLTKRFAATLARAPAKPRATQPCDTPHPQPTTPPHPRQPDKLPRARGWLRRLVPNHWVNGHIAEFQRFLETDEMRDIYQTHPTIGRTIRPLCHMMGIPIPETLRLPKPERETPRQVRPKPLRPPEPPQVEPGPVFKPLNSLDPGHGNHYVTFLTDDPKNHSDPTHLRTPLLLLYRN